MAAKHNNPEQENTEQNNENHRELSTNGEYLSISNSAVSKV